MLAALSQGVKLVISPTSRRRSSRALAMAGSVISAMVSATLGCRSRQPASRLTSGSPTGGSRTPSRIAPICPDPVSPAARTTASNSAKVRFTCPISDWPPAVRCTPLFARSNRANPNSSSSLPIRRLIVEVSRPSDFAARPKLPALAAAARYLRSTMSIISALPWARDPAAGRQPSAEFLARAGRKR